MKSLRIILCVCFGYTQNRHPGETVFLSHLGRFCLVPVLRFHHLKANETVFIYGYACVSTHEQDLTLQTQTLRAAGCEIIRSEKASGSSLDGRTELSLLLEFLRPGDTLMVTRVDRLARSIRDLQDIVYSLNQRGITLRATEQPVDTMSAAGKAFLDMLGVFAEFETNLRRERQMEGIAAAKARGVYRGRKPSIDPAEVYRLYVDEKMGATAIARQLGIGRASVYRVLDNYEQPA
ncbi:recombinase family protein [Klebsiella variicola]|nr:recombinase family protein [Klebsiella variicola]MBZ7863936.1 recombinase family protein [Klebsiella variicola]